MATDKSFADFIVDQMQGAGGITAKKMFGEYGVYKDGVIVALICDDKLFIKPTKAGEEFILKDDKITYGAPYPGAKMYFYIKDRFEDRDWISALVTLSKNELGEVKQKRKKKK
ncbi:MAG: TfoX/Sxy family protein [Candidatus Goldbacteria bacterium]|nr:TfoX/Sxy family protein [Candidatus Goldiibacteriota bacterium]